MRSLFAAVGLVLAWTLVTTFIGLVAAEAVRFGVLPLVAYTLAGVADIWVTVGFDSLYRGLP